MSQTYRWNVAEHAAGYDATAHIVHPHYLEIQDAILAEIVRPRETRFLFVDLGGGSGRLAERFLAAFPQARALVIDQSESFLEIAARRMAPFDGRGSCQVARLQDDWTRWLPEPPEVIASMSAIHHLEPAEKRQLYQKAYDALAPGGVLLNGDEIRAPAEGEYLAALSTWAAHMRAVVADGRVRGPMQAMLEKWQDRNVTHFDKPRVSGDDCHETINTQLDYFRACGFQTAQVPWQREMWALLKGIK